MKIAINGAGIGGPTLAYWLARAGHEPLLIEQAPALRRNGYVIDFWGSGYTVADRMGLVPELHRRGYHVTDVRFIDAAGRRAGGFSATTFDRVTEGRFVSLPRGELADAIYATIGDRVETLFGTTISALEETTGGIALRLSNGMTRDVDLVVGADGLHSQVRRLVFGPEESYRRDLGYHVAAFELAGYRPRDELVYVSYSEPGRQVARFALRDDRTLILLVFTSDRLSGIDPGAVGAKAAVHHVFDGTGGECPAILAAMDEVDDVYLDTVSQIRMPQWTRGRVALLGDATACASLLAGEGTGLAMTEAYVLAGELQRAAGNHAEAFAAYEARLRDYVAAKQDNARQLASGFAPRTAFGIWFRNAVTALFSIPGVADYFIGRDLQRTIELPDYVDAAATSPGSLQVPAGS